MQVFSFNSVKRTSDARLLFPLLQIKQNKKIIFSGHHSLFISLRRGESPEYPFVDLFHNYFYFTSKVLLSSDQEALKTLKSGPELKKKKNQTFDLHHFKEHGFASFAS